MEYERLFSLINRVTRQHLNTQLKPLGLSESNFMLVLRVCETPGITQDQLNHEIYREHSIVTKAVNRLSDNGWINITPDSNDHRRTNLYPTDFATNHYAAIKKCLDETNDWLSQTLGIEEQENLSRLLDIVARHVMPKA